MTAYSVYLQLPSISGGGLLYHPAPEDTKIKYETYLSVSVDTRLRDGWPEFNSRQGKSWDLFPTLPPPDRFCGTGGLLPRWKSGRGAKLTISI